MDTELSLSFSYNKELLKIFSKSFYMSTLLLPRDRRQAVFALYGFCRFADNLVDTPRNRSKEEISNEIHFLENELRIAYRTGESEHPVLCAFIRVARQYKIPVVYPTDLFKGLLMDVENKPYKNFDELYLFCHRVAGVVGLMMTHILGYTSDKAFGYAAKLGVAMQLTNILRDIQEDKNSGRLYLPLDDMRRFAVSKDEIFQEQYTPALKAFMQFYTKRAHRYYNEAAPGIPMLKKECQFAIYSASHIYRGILHEIEKNNYNPFKGRVHVNQLQKMKIILASYIKGKCNPNNETNDCR